MNTRVLLSLMIIGFVGVGLGSSTMAMFNDSENSNNNQFTAGELDLRVDWNESYNGENIETQELTNDPGAIFEIGDMKPGDKGEATVSLHLEDNPGWIWMNIDQTANWDNACTDPEHEAEDGNCGSVGELDEELELAVWADDGDNIKQGDENMIFEGTAAELEAQSDSGILLDGNPSTNQTAPFSGDETGYIGIKYKIPLETGNRIQGDSLKYDISFYTEQRRHNDNPENPWTESEDNQTEEPVNESLEASFVRANDEALSTEEGNEVRLYSTSTDDDDISKHEWSMGDGTTKYGQDVLHNWSSPGNYSINLEVTGSDGETDSTSRTMEVTERDSKEEQEESSGNLTFNDQTVDNGKVTLNNVSTSVGSAVFVTYEDGNDTVIAGIHNANAGLNNFNPMEVPYSGNLDQGGVPGQYTARMIEKPIAFGYNPGDVMEQGTLDKEYFSQSAEITSNQ